MHFFLVRYGVGDVQHSRRQTRYGAHLLDIQRISDVAQDLHATRASIHLHRDYQILPWNIDAIVSELREARGRSKRVVVSAGNRRAPLPSPEKLQQVVNGIYASLFPRHAGAFDHSDEGIAFFIGNTLNSALHILLDQTRREHAFIDETRAEHDTPLSAEQIVSEFARGLPHLYETLESDIRAAYDGDP